MACTSSKKRKKDTALHAECPNEDTVSLNLSGRLAERWIKERGSADDISFIKCLLDIYNDYKQEQLHPHIDNKMCAINTECSVSDSLLCENHSFVRKSSRIGVQKSQIDSKEVSREGVALVKVEIERSDFDVPDGEKWKKDAYLEDLAESSEEQNLESDLVEILVNKSEDAVCEICRQKVVGETKRYHVFYEHFTLYVKCKLCEQEFSNETEMSLIDVDEYFSHQSTAHGNLSRGCLFCKQFIEVNTFSRHLIHMHWKQLFCLCNTCGVSADSSTPLCILKGISVGGHLLKKHSIPNLEKVSCEICGVIVLQFNLAKHIKLVHEGAREICELCGKSFNDVDRHKKRVHVESRHQYQCTICDKKLTSKWNLTVHNRLHTGEKPFTCEVCGKSFHQKVELKLHARNNHENPRKLQHNKKVKTARTSKLAKTVGSTVSKKSKSMSDIRVPLLHEDVLQAMISPSKLPASSNVYTVTPSQPCSGTLLSSTGNNVNSVQNVTVIDVHDNKDSSGPQLVWITQAHSSEDISMEAPS